MSRLARSPAIRPSQLESRQMGRAREGGCCQASFPPESNGRSPMNDFAVTFAHKALVQRDSSQDPDGPTSPCSYGMLVESSWYNFSSEDLFGRPVLSNKHPRGVLFVLDFAIRSGNRSCPAEGQKPPLDYVCISGNSSCAKPANGDGYICRCWDNYDGNPYINNGCQGTYTTLQVLHLFILQVYNMCRVSFWSLKW